VNKKVLRTIPIALMCALLTYGCAGNTTSTKDPQKEAVAAKEAPAAAKKASTEASTASKKTSANVYKGKVVGKSNKAKIISLEVGKGSKAQTIAIKFDDKTKGIEHASKGHAAIITYEKRGNDIYAVNIKPKLAKMPEGVTEISVDEVKKLIDKDEDFELIDSHPGHRYSAAHLPGSISIPVCEMQELIGLLPNDKNKLLVFYCGGPT
jgi:hypothetical protein